MKCSWREERGIVWQKSRAHLSKRWGSSRWQVSQVSPFDLCRSALKKQYRLNSLSWEKKGARLRQSKSFYICAIQMDPPQL